MAKAKTCEICGEEFHFNYNEDMGIFTLVTDTDAEGTKRKRIHFCNDCVHTVYVKIQEMALENVGWKPIIFEQVVDEEEGVIWIQPKKEES